MLVLIQCLYEKSQAECWVIDVRLICNSSSICSDKRVGVLSFQEDRRGREGRCGNNTAQIMIVVYWHGCWQVFQECVTGDTFCEGYLCHSELCLKWAITFLPFFICLFPLSLQPLSLSLSVRSPSLFRLPCPYYVPICVTHEACLRVKNKRWNRWMQGEWRGGLTSKGEDMEGKGERPGLWKKQLQESNKSIH